MAVAALLVRKHTRKLTTGGVAYQRIVLRLDGKLLVKARHQLHRPCQILKRSVVAYNILKGKHIAKGVRGIIIPATMAVYKECILRGYTEAFIDAGCIVSTPTCGPCLGGYMGILAAGERCVSTTNRNFVGRMGHVDSEVYLASPATAAASALTGYITDPRTV